MCICTWIVSKFINLIFYLKNTLDNRGSTWFYNICSILFSSWTNITFSGLYRYCISDATVYEVFLNIKIDKLKTISILDMNSVI